MAGTTLTRTVTSMPDSAEEALRLQLNKLIDDHDALVAVVNGVILAAATNIGAVAALDDAVAATAAKIASSQGSTTV